MNEVQTSTAGGGPAQGAPAASVSAEISSLKSRMLALESEAAGYVRTHVVYLASAACLIVGFLGGHFIK